MKEKLYYLLCLREEKEKDWISFLDSILKDLYYKEKAGEEIKYFKRIAYLKYHSYCMFRKEILDMLKEGDF